METENPTIVNTSDNPYDIHQKSKLDSATKKLLAKVIFAVFFTAVGSGLLGFYLGMTYAAEKDGKIVEIQKEAPVETDAPHDSETDSWIAYEDSEVGFRVKAPAELNMESTKGGFMSFTNGDGEGVIHVEAYKGDTAQSNYELNCSLNDVPEEDRTYTPVPPTDPPFSGEANGYRKYENMACWMFDQDIYVHVYNRNEADGGNPGVDDELFSKVLSTFEQIK